MQQKRFKCKKMAGNFESAFLEMVFDVAINDDEDEAPPIENDVANHSDISKYIKICSFCIYQK